jgi:hypothetical protein
MKQKLLLITSLTLLIAGFSVAQVEDDVLLIPKAGEAPVIDGQMDGIWKNVVEVMAEVPDLLNAANRETWWDLWAGFRLLWDDENLYVWVNVNDDSINPGTDWQNDSVEFYFDGDNSKTPGDYDAFDDSQVRFNFGETTPAEVNFGGGKTWGGTTSDNWEYIFVETEVGYNLELKIPLADIRLDIGPDLEFGFDIQLNDADETTRDMVYRWWTDDDNAWQDASLFGTAMFVEGGTAVDPDIGHATNFSLSQNYPNPFNPETSIQYSVGSESMVRLTVYDLLGNQVAELVHEQQPAGQYTAVFDGSGLASGMYFYRLQTGDKIITRKMTLLQ